MHLNAVEVMPTFIVYHLLYQECADLLPWTTDTTPRPTRQMIARVVAMQKVSSYGVHGASTMWVHALCFHRYVQVVVV